MTQMTDSKYIEKIVLEYILKVRQLEEEMAGVLTDRVEDLVTRVLLRMNQNLKNQKQVKKYDLLYDLAEEMKRSYRSYLQALDQGKEVISDPMVKEIFDGMGEMATSALANMPSKSDNPITYERMVLINGGILRVKQHYFQAMEDEKWSGSLGNDVSPKCLMAYIEDQLFAFFERNMTGVVALLDESLVLLADFSEGKKYQTFVEDQVKRLSSLAVKQKEVIMEHLITDEEKVYVTDLLTSLTALCERSEKALETIEADQGNLVSGHHLMSMDQLQELMKSQGFRQAKSLEELLSHGRQIKERSIGELKEIMAKEVHSRTHEVGTWMTDEAAGFQQLSGQMVNLFFETVVELETTPESFETDQGKAIIKGIKETMALKLESFREKDTAYQLGKKDIFIELEQRLLDQSERFMEGAEALLMAAVAGDEAYLPRMVQRLSDQVDEVKKRHFNYNIDYLRHELLFELKTYEELIEHSLRKLIELEPDKSKEMTEIMLATLAQSRVILSNHDIELIMPQPHDKFVGKYHEVMLAEEEEGFLKGEVVKTIHIGYQLKKHVILRASVLAAR